MIETSLDQVWDALQEVKDPEIPTVSVVELGLIRQVGFEGSRLIVTLAPTFVGCPALDVMGAAIEEQLLEIGIDQVEVKLVFQPPWTSDLITSEGREKLKQIGLAPPPKHGGELERFIEASARCPYCDSTETEMKNSFGSTLCRAIYFCNNCTQPFEQFKPI
jgi:ring-1,2-phenylacetyl-CoA epoxidase subunit PaaD